MSRIFSSKTNIVLSALMFLAGITISVLNLFDVIGKDEPFWVFQMSAIALWFSGYGNILIAVVRHEHQARADEIAKNS